MRRPIGVRGPWLVDLPVPAPGQLASRRWWRRLVKKPRTQMGSRNSVKQNVLQPCSAGVLAVTGLAPDNIHPVDRSNSLSAVVWRGGAGSATLLLRVQAVVLLNLQVCGFVIRTS